MYSESNLPIKLGETSRSQLVDFDMSIYFLAKIFYCSNHFLIQTMEIDMLKLWKIDPHYINEFQS